MVLEEDAVLEEDTEMEEDAELEEDAALEDITTTRKPTSPEKSRKIPEQMRTTSRWNGLKTEWMPGWHASDYSNHIFGWGTCWLHLNNR